MYIEPNTVVPSAERTLLMGFPAYVADSSALKWSDGTLFGVLFPPADSSIPISAPPGISRPAMARAVASGPDRWHVVFAELDDNPILVDRRVVSLWEGFLAGDVWKALFPIPVPPRLELSWLLASALVRRPSGGLAFAAPVSWGTSASDVILFEKVDSVWSHRFLGAPSAVYASIGIDRTGDLLIAVVRPDTRLQADGNSLFLYTASNPSRNHRIALGGTEPVHAPIVSSGQHQTAVSWWVEAGRRREARTWFDSAVRPVVVDSSIVDFHVAELENGFLWITDHVDIATRARSVRFFFGNKDIGISAVGSAEYRFDGGFVALKSNGDLYVIGPALLNIAGDTTLGELQMRYRVDCSQ